MFFVYVILFFSLCVDEVAENEEEAEDDDEDDDAPTETAIDQEPTIPSKVKSGLIPDSIPHTRIVHVNKLPKSKFFFPSVFLC